MPADEESLLAFIEKGSIESRATRQLGQHPPRLLLVEDHAPLAEVTAEFLREGGLEVRIAESGEEALSIAIEFRPEIVLCDMRLPEMSGLAVAHALRGNSDTKHVVIAIQTASSVMEIRALESEIRTDEVNFFFSKPITPKQRDILLGALDGA